MNQLTVAFEATRKAFSMAPVLPGVAKETAFPFINGDTYRSLASVVFDQDSVAGAPFPAPLAHNHAPTGSLVFVENILAQIDSSFLHRFIDWIDGAPDAARYKIIFANGDFPPPQSIREELVSRGHRLFGQNFADGEAGVTPIPIGIQNFSENRHRALDDLHLFYDLQRRNESLAFERKVPIFTHLNVQSNPQARLPVKEFLNSRNHRPQRRRLSLRNYRRHIMSSLFVPSPAGIGPDCFRTWEALYLGAIPVLLEGTIAPSISNGLPIWIVEGWEELFERSDSELREVFDSLASTSRRKAYFPHWQRVLDFDLP